MQVGVGLCLGETEGKMGDACLPDKSMTSIVIINICLSAAKVCESKGEALPAYRMWKQQDVQQPLHRWTDRMLQ